MHPRNLVKARLSLWVIVDNHQSESPVFGMVCWWASFVVQFRSGRDREQFRWIEPLHTGSVLKGVEAKNIGNQNERVLFVILLIICASRDLLRGNRTSYRRNIPFLGERWCHGSSIIVSSSPHHSLPWSRYETAGTILMDRFVRSGSNDKIYP